RGAAQKCHPCKEKSYTLEAVLGHGRHVRSLIQLNGEGACPRTLSWALYHNTAHGTGSLGDLRNNGADGTTVPIRWMFAWKRRRRGPCWIGSQAGSVDQPLDPIGDGPSCLRKDLLIAEGFHHAIPKDTIDFAMGCSLVVEMINLRRRRSKVPSEKSDGTPNAEAS
ncbi:MAG: hypothetical protein AAFX99_15965, partial [Myxococcota bacterium]